MKVGLVGYAGTGKSTVFQWLTGVAPDPGKVQQGQIGTTKVPDERLKLIAEKYTPKKLTFAEIQFLDTPGLSVDDRKDNPRRLAILRESNGLVVVLDGFGATNFAEQFQKFREELLFADLEVVSNRVPKVEAQFKKAKPAKEREADEFELATLNRLVAAFEAGTPAKHAHITEAEEKVLRSFQLLTLKPDAAFVNRGDSGFNDPLPADLLALAPAAVQAPVKLENELVDLDEESRQAFMADLGLKEFSRDRVVRAIFAAMGREVFFTVGHDECRSWALNVGSNAVEAAACIHRELGEKFVRANVIGYADFVACGMSEKEAKSRGLERTEGKTYIVRDADILHILASA
jgi:ribosome-binding ATPase YchF (GTP1/OBG family)